MSKRPRISSKVSADPDAEQVQVRKPLNKPKRSPKDASQTIATPNVSSGGTGWADEHRGKGGAFVIIDGKRVRAD